MKDKQTEINMQDIMNKIRLEIAKKKEGGIYNLSDLRELKKPITSSINDLNFLLSQLDRYSQIKINDLELSKKPLVGPTINIVKKIINKTLYWYMHGIVQQVNIFNSYVLMAIKKMASDKNDEFEEKIPNINESTQKDL